MVMGWIAKIWCGRFFGEIGKYLGCNGVLFNQFWSVGFGMNTRESRRSKDPAFQVPCRLGVWLMIADDLQCFPGRILMQGHVKERENSGFHRNFCKCCKFPRNWGGDQVGREINMVCLVCLSVCCWLLI